MIGCRQITQRIAAKNRRFAGIDEQPQDDKLTCLEERKRLPIDWRQNEGSYAGGFFMNIRDSHLSKAGPSWRLFLIRESRIPRRSLGAQVLLEHCLERTLPTLAERGNPQRALQLLARMSRQIQQGVGVGHTDFAPDRQQFLRRRRPHRLPLLATRESKILVCDVLRARLAYEARSC